MALTSEQWKSLEDMAQQIGQETIANGLGSPEAQATGSTSYNQNASPRERYNQFWEIRRQQATETSERRKERSESVRSNFLSTMNQIQEKQNRIPETSATLVPGSVQAENLEFLSQYQQENSLLARLKKAGQAAISGIKDAVASNTDAQRALYEAGQSGREMRMQEDLKDLEDRLAEAQRAYGQLKEQVAAGNKDFTERDVQDKADQIKQLEVQISAYKKAPEAQRGATEETSKLADEIKKSAEKDIERAKQGRNNFERFLLDATAGGTQLLGDIGAGALTGAGAMPSLALRAFGGGTQQARQAGASLGQQIGFGAATATVEMLTEKMADGLAGAFGKGAADDVAEEVIRRLATTPAGQTALRTLYSMGGEGVEEVVSEIVSPALKAIYDKGESAKESYGTKEGRKALAADALYSGLLGAALGAPGSAVNIATGRDAQENARNQELTDIYGEIGTPNVGQAVKDRDILKNIRGGKDYGNLSVGDQASEAMEALRGITPESVRAGQLSEARNRLFEMQQQRAAEAQAAQAAKPVAENATTDASTRPSNPLYDSLQTAQKAAGAQEAPEGQITQPTAETTPQKAGTAQAAEETPKSNVQRFQEIQNRLNEIENQLQTEQDDETISRLYEEGEALYQESRQLESLPEVIQQKRVDDGEVSKGFGTVENHIDNRTDKDLSKPSVKAFQFDHPELHQYFVDVAQELIADVEYAEKLTKANMYELGSAIESGPVRQLMDMGLTKPEIIKALQDIIANNGQENYAKAKKVERVLSQMMTDGWRDLKNQNHDAVPDYIAAKDSINGAVKSDSWEKYLADHETVLALGEVTEEQLRAEWEKKQNKGKNAEQRKAGTVSFDGGTIDGTTYNGIDPKKISRHQKKVVALVQRLADVVNIDYVFFDGPAHVGGAYQQGGVVYININSGLNPVTNQSIAAATLSHELTHFMQEFAPNEYEALKDFIFSSVLSQDQAEFDRLIRQQQRWEPDKSYTEIVDELIANACQNMLQNDRVIKQMARQNMNLAEKVADILADLAAKIKDAFKGIDPNTYDIPVFDAVKAVAHEADSIAEKWGAGIGAAVDAYNVADRSTSAKAQQRMQFLGERAEQADYTALDRAKVAESRGISNNAIRQQTGWFRGMDGKWRFEIDSSKMNIKELNSRTMALLDTASGFVKLKDLVDFDELFRNYPALGDVNVRFRPLGDGNLGQWESTSDEANTIAGQITLNDSYFDALDTRDDELLGYMLDTLAHEIQHIVQDYEGFSQGAGPDYWQEKISDGYGEGDERDAYDLYYNTAGEIEARDAENRRTYDKEKRKTVSPDLGDESTVFVDDSANANSIKSGESNRQNQIWSAEDYANWANGLRDAAATTADGTQSEQSAGTIPASEQTTAERTNGTGNERERNMSRNLRGNEKAEPELRNSFEQNRDLYTQLTNAEVAAKAAEIIGKGYDAAKNDIYEKIGQAKAGAKLAPEYAVAGYQLANEMVRRGEIEAARELCADIAAELTYAGQVGQIGRLILAADPSIRIRTVERLVKKLNDGLSNRQKAKNVENGVGTETGNIKVSDEALQEYAAAETDEAANKALDAIEQEIADQIPATFRDKFTALRYLNMLGNLKTQGRNIVGNAAMMTATNIKYLTQHVIELARAAATGGKYEVNTALNTSKELRQQAAADFEANIDEIKGEAKYADVGRQATKGIQDKRQILGTTGNKLWDNTVGRGLEAARKATNWAMEIGDEIFLRQVYVRSFAGWMKAHGVTDVNSASAEQVSAAREFAKKEAQEATFHDSNKVSDWVSSLGRGPNTPEAVKMISEGVVPFRKTPANVAVRAVEYSPVGAIGTIYEAIQAKKGNASAADVINSAAKNLTGTALFGIGMLLAAAGRARASGDDEDEKLNEFEKLQGEMDYSIKVGDKYISLSQLAPMAIPFFMGVKLNELLESNDNLFSVDSIGDLLGVVSDPMLEMSMLSGVNDFLNDLSSLNGDTDAVPSLVTNAALSYLSQGLTNSLLGQLEQASERNRQTTYSDTKSKAATAFDRFLGKNQYKIGKYSAKIPGLDYNQQDYVDAWGRTQSNGGAGERAFNAFLNPTYTGKDRSTDVDEELERLYRDNKGKDGFPNVFPQKRSRSDAIGDGVVMTPDEYLSYSKESGQKKLELVREFMQSSDYKNLTDEQRAETIHNLYSFADATALQKVRDANGVTVENKYAKISGLSDVPAYLAATERFKAEAAKEGKEFNGWTNTNFEKYVSAGLKAEDLDVLAESALSDARKPAYDLMREVGMSPKEYMDAIAVMDGEKHDGQFKQADVYNWLVKNTTMSTEQKNQLWDMLGNNWKTSYADYAAKNGGDESKATKSSGNALYDYYAERQRKTG